MLNQEKIFKASQETVRMKTNAKQASQREASRSSAKVIQPRSPLLYPLLPYPTLPHPTLLYPTLAYRTLEQLSHQSVQVVKVSILSTILSENEWMTKINGRQDKCNWCKAKMTVTNRFFRQCCFAGYQTFWLRMIGSQK